MRSVATGQKEKPHRLGSQTVGFFYFYERFESLLSHN